MNDSNALNKAFRKYNVGKIASIIGKNGLRQPHDANEFIKTLRHSTCLAIQIENTQSEKLRDLLITYSRELINTCPDQDIRQAFEDHVADAKIVELGYREIFRTIHSSKIWQHPPDEQVWGVIYRAEREFILLKAASEKGLDELAENEKSVLDPRQFKIAMDAGLKLKLDAVVTGIVRNAADTLITLAYAHGWFKKDTGAIEIPCETTVNEEISFKVGSFSHAAHLWRELGNAWSRACFFNAKFRLRKEKFPVKQGGSKVTTVLESTAA
ncbi:MAG: hypothetical protein JWO94_20, partial [Verrucomicrobiaceae bacterium]|nr:hypothetical protein [Verrucomicrobiaceae bacterium]